MSSFHCPGCAKDWPENYCPECARPIASPDSPAEHVIDSDIVNDSYSTCSAKIHINPFRYFWYKDEPRLLVYIWLPFAVITGIAFALRWWIFGGLVALPLLLITGLIWWIYRRVDQIFYNALLTAGMVVNKTPLEFIAVTNMRTGMGRNTLAVKRVTVIALPSYPAEIGTQFACVSSFKDGPTFELWGDFDPQPLSFGTGNKKLLQQREEKLGKEAFRDLKRIFDEGNYPKKADELIWLDPASFRRIPPPVPPT